MESRRNGPQLSSRHNDDYDECGQKHELLSASIDNTTGGNGKHFQLSLHYVVYSQ